MDFESAGCERCSVVAAFEMLSSLATQMKYLSWWISMQPPWAETVPGVRRDAWHRIIQ